MDLAHVLFGVAGISSVVLALLHVVVIYAGAPAYRYFGAGEAMARMAEKGSWVPGIVTGGITAVFLLFAAYAFAAAGWLQLPAVAYVVAGIAAIYTLRGIMVLPLLLAKQVSRFDINSSLLSLVIGLIHFAGLYAAGTAP